MACASWAAASVPKRARRRPLEASEPPGVVQVSSERLTARGILRTLPSTRV